MCGREQNIRRNACDLLKKHKNKNKTKTVTQCQEERAKKKEGKQQYRQGLDGCWLELNDRLLGFELEEGGGAGLRREGNCARGRKRKREIGSVHVQKSVGADRG